MKENENPMFSRNDLFRFRDEIEKDTITADNLERLNRFCLLNGLDNLIIEKLRYYGIDGYDEYQYNSIRPPAGLKGSLMGGITALINCSY